MIVAVVGVQSYLDVVKTSLEPHWLNLVQVIQENQQ